MKNLFILFFFFVLPCPFMFSQEENEKASEKHPILTDRFQFEAGIFFPSKNVKIGANGSSPNDNISFGETFNLNDSETTIFFKFDWHFSKKWKLSVESFSIQNAKKVDLKEDIEFEDIVFKKGSNIRGGFGLNMYRIYVGRTFSRGLKHEFGAGLGIHALNTSAFIEGDVLSSEGDLNFERRAVSALVPLPNLGAWYYYAPTSKWAFIARLDWFGITVGDYSGSLWNIAPGIKYQLFKHIGVGIDYRYFIVKANVNKTDWKGQFSMNFNGPLFVVHTNF
jgi:hypothetical protein